MSHHRRRLPVVVMAALAAALTACTVGSEPSAIPTANVTQPDPTTRTPMTTAPDQGTGSPQQAHLDARLRDAAWANDMPAARRLIADGADVNAKDETVQSAYLITTSEGHLDLLDLTLANGADVGSRDSYNGTGLIRAADRGHADVVGRLIGAGIDVDHVNRLGWTALHEAIVLGDGSARYVDTVRVLVAGHADLMLPSRGDGISPVQHARSRGFDAVATSLRAGLDADRDPMSTARADTALLRAAEAGDADALAVALRAGADIEARDAHRRTALLLASAADQVEVARLLVYLGADPDAVDDRSDTPWLVTGVTGSVPMLKILLPAHPDLTLRNRYGGVSVIPASERGHVDYVRRVVRTGIDADHVNRLGWTALLEAVILGDGSRPYQEIVGILLAAGATPTLADADGTTPLEHARSKGFDEIVRLLDAAENGSR